MEWRGLDNVMKEAFKEDAIVPGYRLGRAEVRCPVETGREKHVWETEKGSHNTWSLGGI